nr:ABC transporter substrate-binding protein/permease [Macrococcus bovicus]
MPKRGLFSLVMLIVLLFTLIPAPVSAKEDLLDTARKRGELRVGLAANAAPFEFERNVNGKNEYAGIDISLIEKIGKDHGLKIKIVNMTFDSLLGALKTGKIDVIVSGMTPTPERQKKVDFSDNYLFVDQKVIVKKKDKDQYTSFADFKGKTIAVQKQTAQEEIAQKEIPDASLNALTRTPDIIMAVQTGKAEAAVIDSVIGDAYLTKNKDLTYADLTFDDGKKETAVAVPKGNPKLLAAINASIKDAEEKGLIEEYQKQANKDMFDDGTFLNKYGSYFLRGIGATVLISLLGVIFGSLFGGIFAFMKLSANKVLRAIAWLYIEFIRGTPLLVQLFLVYFGTTAVLGLDLSAFLCGAIALILNCGAYIAEIIRAGIQAVDKGQIEAARSLGLSHAQAMNKVIMPQAVKNILPALGNEFITVIKESSIVSVIGVSELMFNAQVVQGASFDPFTPLVITAAVYFVLTFALSRLINLFERRLSVSD